MAGYVAKYRFNFEDIHGVDISVIILEDGYEGDVTIRPLGKAPVIRMQRSDPFRSTSCNLVVECQVDGEFAEFYTSIPNKYRVDIYRNDVYVWTGFLATELYSEPDIAPPYDVTLTATDGLGVLKEYDFPARGLQTVRSQFKYLLSQTGRTIEINAAVNIGPTSDTPAGLFDRVSINLDYMAGETCYDVLKELLATLHLTITQYRAKWLIVRESNIGTAINSSGTLTVYNIPTRDASAVSQTTVSAVRKTVGQMYGTANLYPVGHLTRRVVPAKKNVIVEAPWHPASLVQNPDMTSDTEWTKVGSITWNSGGYNYFASGNVHYMYQTFAAGRVVGTRFTAKVRASRGANSDTLNMVRVDLRFQPTGSSTVYYFDTKNKEWTTSQPSNQVEYELGSPNTIPSLGEEYKVDVPALPLTTETGGTFTIRVYGRNANVFHADVMQVMNKGYKDIISMANGARGKGDTYKIAGGRITSEDVPDGNFFQGVFVWSSSPETPIYDWADTNNYGLDFLAITAIDYARSVALPRIELSGKVDIPSNINFIPMVLGLRDVLYLIVSYDWDLLEEDMNFTALSLPASTITVESETVVSTGNAE